MTYDERKREVLEKFLQKVFEEFGNFSSMKGFNPHIIEALKSLKEIEEEEFNERIKND